MASDKKILVVEDDETICAAVTSNIRGLGFGVDFAHSGDTGLSMALSNEYALMVIDLMLPRMDGLEVCRRVREENKTVPILMLTARTDEVDRVVGLEVGATDYLTKPFSMPELLARIKSMLRLLDAVKGTSKPESNLLQRADLLIDLDKKTVLRNGVPITLTLKEFDLLAFLAAKPGRPYTREEIMENVWGYVAANYENNVVTHINRLRGKIEDDAARPRYVLTRRGVGYYFTDKAEAE